MEEVLSANPSDLLRYLNKKVKIVSKLSKSFEGDVFTIDPITLSFVIISSSNKTLLYDRIIFVIGDHISSINIIDHHNENKEEIRSTMENFITSIANISNNNYDKLGEEDLSQRKRKMIAWFKGNQIPVEEKGECVVVGGMVEITPPYDQHSCMCSNPIVLGKFQKMTAQIEESEFNETL